MSIAIALARPQAPIVAAPAAPMPAAPPAPRRAAGPNAAGGDYGPQLPPLTDYLIGKLAVYAFEVINGERYVAQFGPWVSNRVAAYLAGYRALYTERRCLLGDKRRVVPVVQRVLSATPHPGTMECTVIINVGQRSRAIALQFRWRRERWQATVLQLV